MLSIFNKHSNAVEVLKECTENANIFTFDEETLPSIETLYQLLARLANGLFTPVTLTPAFENYSARNLTQKQTELFERALKHYEAENTNA